MSTIPNQRENPTGFHQRHKIQKIVQTSDPNYNTGLKTIDVDSDAEYFVMRLDCHGTDMKHVEACRKAVLYYARLIKDHIPSLSEDLIARYSDQIRKQTFSREEVVGIIDDLLGHADAVRDAISNEDPQHDSEELLEMVEDWNNTQAK